MQRFVSAGIRVEFQRRTWERVPVRDDLSSESSVNGVEDEERKDEAKQVLRWLTLVIKRRGT